jgi:hypothetical protein
MPDLNESLVKWCTSCNVHHSDVEYELDTLLRFSNVIAKELVVDKVRAFCHFWSSNACGLFDIRLASERRWRNQLVVTFWMVE